VPVARCDLGQQRQHRVAEVAGARDHLPRLARDEAVRLRVLDLAAYDRQCDLLETGGLAWFFLGFWFVYQLFEANFGLFGAKANGGGVAFFAHVGGFIFGVSVAAFLSSVGRVAPQGGGQALLRASA
jgi:membrane associated rhomboid family serine protease